MKHKTCHNRAPRYSYWHSFYLIDSKASTQHHFSAYPSEKRGQVKELEQGNNEKRDLPSAVRARVQELKMVDSKIDEKTKTKMPIWIFLHIEVAEDQLDKNEDKGFIVMIKRRRGWSAKDACNVVNGNETRKAPLLNWIIIRTDEREKLLSCCNSWAEWAGFFQSGHWELCKWNATRNSKVNFGTFPSIMTSLQTRDTCFVDIAWIRCVQWKHKGKFLVLWLLP